MTTNIIENIWHMEMSGNQKWFPDFLYCGNNHTYNVAWLITEKWLWNLNEIKKEKYTLHTNANVIVFKYIMKIVCLILRRI